jgi:beta-glucanase (GH16 family)
VRDPARGWRIAFTIDLRRWIVAKFHAVLVGLGVLLILLAGALSVNLLVSGGKDDDEITTTPTSTPRPSGVPTGRPTITLPGPTTPTSLVPVSVSAPPPKSSSSAANPSTAPTWNMVWSDTFSGGTLESAWSKADNQASGQSCFVTANISFDPDGIVLTGDQPAAPYACGAATTPYTGAHVYTNATWRYGAVEVRARTTGILGPGLWPGIWLSANNGTGLDIAMFYGAGGATHAIHPGGSSTSGATSTDWHIYRIEWEANQVRWYVDGTQRWTQTPGSTVCDGGCNVHLAFNVGGTAAGAVTEDTPFPSQLKVDYVRVYQR